MIIGHYRTAAPVWPWPCRGVRRRIEGFGVSTIVDIFAPWRIRRLSVRWGLGSTLPQLAGLQCTFGIRLSAVGVRLRTAMAVRRVQCMLPAMAIVLNSTIDWLSR